MLGQGIADIQRLFAGSSGIRRWRQCAILCAMAGAVGVGAAPPPLGLLPPLWANPEVRAPIAGSPVAMSLLLLLALVLIAFGPLGRALTFGLMEGLSTGEPQAKAYREYLQPAMRHFLWSSALTLPLYALLFLGEAAATHDVYGRFAQLLANPPEDAANRALALLGEGALRFLLVLGPWTLLTLPAFVLLYELTPASMWLYRLGPVAASGRVLLQARRASRRFWSYLGLRLLLQLAGNTLAGVALLVALLVTMIPGGLLLGVGWAVAVLLGGPSTTGGIVALTVAGLTTTVLLYCVLSFLLTPVSALLYRLALRVMQ